MSRHFLLPHEALRPYVDRYWAWQAKAFGVALPPMLPGTGAELMFPSQGPACLVSMRSCVFDFGSDWGFSLFSARIRSGALRHLCPIPLEELFDRPLRLEDVWGGEGRRLEDEMGGATTDALRAAILDAWLMARLSEHARPNAGIELAVWHLYYGHRTVRVEALAEQLGMSRRHFERLFFQHIGMSPKRFQRTARFHLTARDLLLASERSNLDLALDHGYYDQPHFIREFESFVGESPSRFLARASARSHFYNPPLFSPDRVPLPR